MSSNVERVGRWRHSDNQKTQKLQRDRREKGFGSIDKALKVQLRREKKQQLLEEELRMKKWLSRRSKMQFNRALGHVIDGTWSDEDVWYVAEKIDKYEQVLERFRVRKFRNGKEISITEVTTTIVDFTRRQKQ